MSQAQRWGPGHSREGRGKALAILESVAYCFPPWLHVKSTSG